MKKRQVRIKKNVKLQIIEHPHLYLKKSFKEIKPLMIEIQSIKEEDKIIRNALIEYVIVKTVTIFEIYFKSLAYEIGSNLGDKLDQILKGDLTDSGAALAHSFSYANPFSVKDIFSELLEVDIMEDAKKYFDNFNNEGIEHEEYHIRFIPLLSNNLVNFDKLFVYRNKIVHENFSPPIKYTELRKMVGSVFDVMAWSQMYNLRDR